MGFMWDTGRCLARLGVVLVGVELGENLAAIARRNLSGFPNAHVEVGGFEDLLRFPTFDGELLRRERVAVEDLGYASERSALDIK